MVDTNRVTNGNNTITPELEKLLHKIAKQEGMTNYDMNIRCIPPDGSNYIGMLSVIDIKGTTVDGEKELNIFVKSTLPDKDNIEVMSLTKAYLKERFAYLELGKIYEEFQEQANVPHAERYRFTKCYEETNSEYTILENMVKKGFSVRNRFEVISVDFAEKSIQQLARFHALSRVLEKKRPMYFNDVIKPIRPAAYFNQQRDVLFSYSLRITLGYIEGNAKEKLEKAIPALQERFVESIKNPFGRSDRCVCHGDFRTLNVLQKLQDGVVTEVVPVDYQMLYYGPGLADFTYFIFGATDSKFRRKHLDNLKNLYYDTMENFLQYFSIDIETVFPKEDFERLYKESLDFGLYISIWYLHFSLAKEDELPDVTKISALNFSVSNEIVKYRLQGIVNDFIDWGYL